MLATQREKRINAGNKMSKLLEAEDDDDFYKTTYGGFDEEEEDKDYNSSQSDSDDVIDSDFSIDENDEVKSDDDVEGKPTKKRKGVVTKAYKDPKGEKDKEKKPVVKKPKKEKPKEIPSTVQIYVSPERKSVRRSTALKSEAASSRQKLDLEKDKMLKDMAAKKNVSHIRRMTQEELLEEAKITEIQNMKSLENYQKLELEKKRARVVKQVYQGPIIRYHSLTMPLIEELPYEPDVDVDSEEVAEVKKPELTVDEKCERTFITFTDESTFREIFPQVKIKPPGKTLCPVTKLPAKYLDPITQTPYSNAQAFRLIRDAYSRQLESESKSRASSPLVGVKRKEKNEDSPQTVSVTV
ncbi:vacuolar protein sorting-associated protein 72 isoform X2 [Biomphalaria glabrata]|uniref:Vacuolar protein sorting-associated protein 72 homolog n=1 Tax=Biomphalaria glabrata TaxID=6526 RepID=A0A2C9JVC6_BIOGL|nr:vacuolar protein sorting-associated protein 72 homolog isoform X2 [Biomphalaria glabrata]KAI8733435.1 putative vacuolar protein sorting-associated protein 72 isoform X2 [Biomphalaria glabrata]KAI8743611.1 vacuolar protein sorting-associated protein 72 isoform X2 [Biomphalaria glabrata]